VAPGRRSAPTGSLGGAGMAELKNLPDLIGGAGPIGEAS
jgi:hypothetical protein